MTRKKTSRILLGLNITLPAVFLAAATVIFLLYAYKIGDDLMMGVFIGFIFIVLFTLYQQLLASKMKPRDRDEQ